MSPRTGGKAGWHLIFSIIGITGGGSLAISMTWRFIWGRHVRESVDFIDGEPRVLFVVGYVAFVAAAARHSGANGRDLQLSLRVKNR